MPKAGMAGADPACRPDETVRMTAIAETAPSSLADSVAGLQARQQQGQHDSVLLEAAALLRDYPENRDLLLLEASSLRLIGRIAEAHAALDRLAEHHPRFSRLHQERGLCHVAHKDAPAAIASLLEAVNINPALPMSWRMLEGVYRLTGDPTHAATAAAQVATLAALPVEVVRATSLFADGDLVLAEAIIRAFLIAHGDEPEAMRLLAKIGMAREILDDAELLLAAVLERVPDHVAARLDYAQCLVQRHRYAAARSEVDRLLAIDPDHRDYRLLAATVAIGLGQQEPAINLYRSLLADAPYSADLNLWLGHALKTVGQVDEAVEAYRAAIVARPDFGDAYWSMANLKLYRFSDAELNAMRTAEAAPGTAIIDRIHLCFALGKALEDRGDTAGSWACYDRGNALQRAENRYDPSWLEGNTRQQTAVCTPSFFATRNGWGAPDHDPIFIVGLPRSGSTLIEQILSSHSEVEGTQELPEIQRYVFELQGAGNDPDNPRYPTALADMTASDFAALGRRYIDETRIYRSDTPRFIDKMPNNFRHIGLIHLMLPNAVIIDARRDPMSCCFSNLKQLFANGQEFSYGIEDIARYYRTYLELMRHWDAALPGRVLRVQHEDVVDDLEGSVRRLLDHCGLAFEPACLEFHKNRRSVRTPSSEQVRRPIFRDGLDQWKRYERELAPLTAALGDAVSGYRK
jgi:tetratricopeptide (TPR) repeat protein